MTSDALQTIPSYVEKHTSEDNKSYEAVDLMEKIQNKFPKHKLQFWEYQEIRTCLPEVVVAIGIKVIIFLLIIKVFSSTSFQTKVGNY